MCNMYVNTCSYMHHFGGMGSLKLSITVFVYFMLQRALLQSLGGSHANDAVLKCISKLIERPNLAETFNCGGLAKAGSLVLTPSQKHNFIGTECHKTLLRM